MVWIYRLPALGTKEQFSCSIIKFQSFFLHTKVCKGIFMTITSKHAEGTYKDYVRIVKCIIILSLFEKADIYHCLIISGSFNQLVHILRCLHFYVEHSSLVINNRNKWNNFCAEAQF